MLGGGIFVRDSTDLDGASNLSRLRKSLILPFRNGNPAKEHAGMLARAPATQPYPPLQGH